MSKKRQVDEDPDPDDDEEDQDQDQEAELGVSTGWSFNRAPAAASVKSAKSLSAGGGRNNAYPSLHFPAADRHGSSNDHDDHNQYEGDDEDEDPEAISRAWASLTHDEGSSAPLPVLPSPTMTTTKIPAPVQSYSYQPNRKHVPQPVMLSLMSPDVVDALTTYDKPERSAASPETRHSNFVNRVHRAGDKVQEAAARGQQQDKVDDSLMRDVVGKYLHDYRRHADLKTSERVLPPAPTKVTVAQPRCHKRTRSISVADTGAEEDEDRDEEQDEVNGLFDEDDEDAYDVNTRLAVELPFDEDGEDQDNAASRMLVAPMRRVPNTADTQSIRTFSEYTGPSPASGQFTDNIRHVKGRERGVYMELRDLEEDIYPVVTEKLAGNQYNNAVQRIAVKRGYVVPDPPLVTKAEIQDGLHAPNTLLGERPCVRGVKCASWKMCLKRMQNMPETHRGARPFVCKEFYFGDRGEDIRTALKEGRPLAEVQAPELIMCVMCHLRLVTKWYKRFLAGLVLEPPHILHSFQVSMGVPGGYPIDKCLMGDDTFLGVTAPYLRHVPDNYVWKSSSGVTERDPITGRMVVREGPVIQCWQEQFHRYVNCVGPPPAGSSTEAVRLGWLYPQRPYTTQVSTFHIPTVESALLHHFSKGNIHTSVKAVNVIFQDTLRKTHAKLIELQCIPADATLVSALSAMPTLRLALSTGTIMWTPKFMAADAQERPETLAYKAASYSLLLALHWRINGASSVFIHGQGRTPDPNTREKIRRFVDAHVALAMRIDQLPDPSDAVLLGDPTIDVPSMGPTYWIEDRDLIVKVTHTVALEPTPFQVLDIEGNTRMMLGKLAYQIRSTAEDSVLEALFVGENQVALEHYYPLPMTSAAECRSHSWWLACLLIINKSWAVVVAMQRGYQLTEEDESADISKLHGPDNKAWPNLRIAYAHHRIIGSFINLLYAVIGYKLPHTDDAWRPRPDAAPSVLDLHFPEHTSCFHAGDLPALECVFDQIGLYGVQVVKGKVDLAKVMIKAMPICCQSRDLLETLLDACRKVNNEGFWRVIRAIFWCGLTGLYPHARQRVPFRDMLRIHHLLFHDKEAFLDALEYEKKQRAANPPPGKKTDAATKTCQLIEVVMREFFIHSVETNPDWVSVVNERIKWDQFRFKTYYMADEMRRYGRFTEASNGNEFEHAIDALTRCKTTCNNDVYRYQKQAYVAAIVTTINLTQDALHEKRCEEGREITLMEDMLYALSMGDILDADDMAPLLKSRHAATRFDGDPLGMYSHSVREFEHALESALADSKRIYEHDLGYAVPDHIKRNIIQFLVNTHPDERYRFDYLLDPRLGGIDRATVQTMAKTCHVHATRSSPKTIRTHIQNLPIDDLRLMGWYFNMVSRIERFNLHPLHATMIEEQAQAMRRFRFHLLDYEPLPPGAWRVYICICCKRIATFSDSAMYGNFGVSYDPHLKTMVCSKKASRAARVRHRPADITTALLETDVERAKNETSSRQKRARAERKEDNSLPCEGQPVIPVDLYGSALEFDGDRYLICPGCGQFHTYRDTGWGRDGYRCKGCRDAETQVEKTLHCAYCKGTNELRSVDILATFKDPCNPQHSLVGNPTGAYQTLIFCQKCANSIGLFAKHPNDRYHEFMPKERLWELISPATVARTIKHYERHK